MIDQLIFHICEKNVHMWGKTPESEVLSCLNPGWIFGGFFFSNRNKFAIPDSIRRFLSLDTTPHVIVAILTLSRIFYLYIISLLTE